MNRSILYPKEQIESGSLYSINGEFIEAEIPTTQESNHGSSLIELQNGDLLCVWFAGSDEGAGDIKIYLSRLNNGSGKWSKPTRLSHNFQTADQNPSLFQAPNGNLWLIHTSMKTRNCTLEEWQQKLRNNEVEGPFAMQHTSEIKYRISEDNGYTWSDEKTFFNRPGSFCRHPITILSNGDWVFPVWYSLLENEGTFGKDYSAVMISNDDGANWEEREIPNSFGRVHPSIVELENGKLVCFFRSRAADWIYVSSSNDYGQTWSEPTKTTLPNNNASIRVIKLNNGRITMIFNNISVNKDPNKTIWPYERYPVTIAISEDQGKTWPYMRHLHPGDNFYGERNIHLNRRYEYPFIIQSKDELIHAVYSYGTRECIKYTCFTEDWVTGESRKNTWEWSNFPHS